MFVTELCLDPAYGVAGLVAFSLGHILYIAAFSLRPRRGDLPVQTHWLRCASIIFLQTCFFPPNANSLQGCIIFYFGYIVVGVGVLAVPPFVALIVSAAQLGAPILYLVLVRHHLFVFLLFHPREIVFA